MALGWARWGCLSLGGLQALAGEGCGGGPGLAGVAVVAECDTGERCGLAPAAAPVAAALRARDVDALRHALVTPQSFTARCVAALVEECASAGVPCAVVRPRTGAPADVADALRRAAAALGVGSSAVVTAAALDPAGAADDEAVRAALLECGCGGGSLQHSVSGVGV